MTSDEKIEIMLRMITGLSETVRTQTTMIRDQLNMLINLRERVRELEKDFYTDLGPGANA